jgi:hypothetical protein
MSFGATPEFNPQRSASYFQPWAPNLSRPPQARVNASEFDVRLCLASRPDPKNLTLPRPRPESRLRHTWMLDHHRARRPGSHRPVSLCPVRPKAHRPGFATAWRCRTPPRRAAHLARVFTAPKDSSSVTVPTGDPRPPRAQRPAHTTSAETKVSEPATVELSPPRPKARLGLLWPRQQCVRGLDDPLPT